MKFSWQWLAAISLLFIPLAILLPLGFVALWHYQALLIWLSVGIFCTVSGFVWVLYLRQQQIQALEKISILPDHSTWSNKEQEAWKLVENYHQTLDSQKISLKEPQKLFELAIDLINQIASFYHPNSSASVWEIPPPYLLRIMELVSADLRKHMLKYIPGSHIFTINDILMGKRLVNNVSQYYDAYRVLSVPLNPVSSIMRETKDLIARKVYGAVIENVKEWLLKVFCEKVGFYAIELYSHRLLIDEVAFEKHQTPYSQNDLAETQKNTSQLAEPLRILILGQVNAGKSSIINALIGSLQAKTDIIPSTKGLVYHQLSHEQLEDKILLCDTAGYEEQQNFEQFFKEIKDELLKTDLILLVCAANIAARQADKQLLNTIQHYFQQHGEFQLPPLLVVVTHIDQLRPVREWSPPYNIQTPDTKKAIAIRSMVDALSFSLQVPLAQIIPVNTQSSAYYYNIEEGLIPAMMLQLSEAKRVQYFRTLQSFKEIDKWQQLWQQTMNSGTVMKETVSHLSEKLEEWKSSFFK